MDENLNAFLRVLDSTDNATGGGTACAVAGAMSAALVAMVARLSVGKPGMESEEFYRTIDAEGGKLSRELFQGGRVDAEAFDAVRAAYALPKQSDDAKAARTAAIQAALTHSTRVPLANAALCARVIELVTELNGRSNPNALSDLECAGYLARAGLLGCLANVSINVPGIKDKPVASELAARAEQLKQAASQV